MLNNKRAIILGGGASMREGNWDKPISEMPLWSAIKNECTFGINSVFEFFNPTVITFIDYYFHGTNKAKLDKHPLLIGFDHPNPDKKPKGNNVVLLPSSNHYYGTNSFENVLKKTDRGHKVTRAGIYSCQLSGIFTLTLAVALGFKEIYLLGFDFGGSKKTHFYQEDNASKQVIGVSYKKNKTRICGIGKEKNGEFKTGSYNNNPQELFSAYKNDLKRIKIYNVGLDSRIETFQKIDYPTFYRHLEESPEPILQDRMRNKIRDYIEEKML